MFIAGCGYQISRSMCWVSCMIARLHVLLPFSIAVPEGEKFPIYKCCIDGYEMLIYPPKRSDKSKNGGAPDEIRINDMPAFQADVLHIDFHKDSFDRRIENACDPAEPLINSVINFFLSRLRFVTRASQIRLLDFPRVSWQLRYLNDDESEVERTEGLVRGRFGRRISISWVALNKDVWEAVHKLPSDYVPPHWDSLLLDAEAALPEIGPCLVLAATALEVFIAQILNQLAGGSSIPPELWTWINEREWPLKRPSTEEEFDGLLRILAGRSLKEEEVLWEALTNLKKARNSFVHEGTARIGANIVTEDDTRKLIKQARDIVAFVKQHLPKDLHWPEFQHSLSVKAKKRIFG